MKTSVDDLALFGGPMAFEKTLVVGKPSTGDRAKFYERLEVALDSGRLTSGGPLVKEFEARIADHTGAKHCVATCNGTIALEVMARAAGLTGEVIMPSMTYVATAHAMRYLGLTPVFCDLDPATGCIDPEQVESLITDRTTGLVGVHLWGQPAAIQELEKIAEVHDLTLFFDAAHGIGCTFGSQPLGGFGRAEMFSFHAAKVVTTFEGGAIVTNDDDFAQLARYTHNFGWGEEHVTEFAGTNAKMSEASAAMGLTSLDALPATIAANLAHYEEYSAELDGLPGLEMHRYDEDNRNSYQYNVVKVDEQECGLSRDTILELLRADNVLAQRYFSPCVHECEPYRTERPVSLPATDAFSRRVLTLPTGPSVTSEQVRDVSALIAFAIEHAPEIRRRLAARA
ncbi:aminotransferase class I/II-fold pyridoxal phosphate-dependent enzyme [Amycolatopsis sp. MEPSY49]|uniref:aminotransferase class I/II-fold pyridoxal phosphate-dependent enzyme n=1 Tax=Amycolatopsis sp. MEPSY49 TaxID=3151600 RepID=UPI003EF83D20